MRVDIQLHGLEERLPPLVEGVLFRAIQELVQYVVKHAQASEVTLQIVRSADELTVLARDNGVGFGSVAVRAHAGIGRANIETRLAYLGGQACFDAAPRPEHRGYAHRAAGLSSLCRELCEFVRCTSPRADL